MNLYDIAIAKALSGGGGGGGGGSDNIKLIKTQPLGTLSATTSDTSTGQTITLTDIDEYDLLIVSVVTPGKTVTSNYHKGTVTYLQLTSTNFAEDYIGDKNTLTYITNKINYIRTSSGTIKATTTTSNYGIYPSSPTLANGTVTIPLNMKESSSQTASISDDYTAYVYGVKIYGIWNN